MRISAWLSVLALACGSAFAAPYGSGSADRDAAADSHHSAAVASDSQSRDTKPGGLVDRTKHALRRLGDKMRHAGSKSAGHDEIAEAAARHDTRTMGAAGSNPQDSARQRRMDDAYANWRAKQQR